MQACASHILVETHEEAAAFKAKIEAGDQTFAEVAAEASKCPSGQQAGGALGQFGPGQMVKEFEMVVFGDQPVGEISEPIQTSFGWHLILITERPAQVASARHILVETQEEAQAIKNAIAEDTDFAEQAAVSSKCPSGKKDGGALGTFGRGQMVKEFEEVIFSDLPLGEVSEPFQTQFGWHIVEVTERKAAE